MYLSISFSSVSIINSKCLRQVIKKAGISPTREKIGTLPPFSHSFREQGWRSGESTRLPPMWPGFDSRTRRHMWIEFVLGSRPCSERFFSG